MIINALNAAGLPPDQPGLWLVLFLVFAAIFFVIEARKQSRRAAKYRRDFEQTRVTLAAVQARADEAAGIKAELAEERALRQRLDAEAAANEAKLAERARAMAELSTRMEKEFKATTAELLDDAHKAFLQRAGESFERHRETAKSEGDQRRKALDDLLKPVSDTLTRYEKGLADMRAEQQKSRGELQGQIGALAQSTHDVRREAQKLATALRAGPKTRGRWGEEQLRNVVEIAGMSAYVDFREQASHDDGDKRKNARHGC